MHIKTFGQVDERSLDQLKRCMSAGDAEYGVLCADHHPGYSQPIGGAVAYEEYVSPSGVGFDIACGSKAAQTDLTRADLEDLGGVEVIMKRITQRISFGMGMPARERVDHPVLDRIRNADFAPQRKLAGLAESQLGTVGSGNHYVNLMEDEDGHVWVGVHFGSRGLATRRRRDSCAGPGSGLRRPRAGGRDGFAAGPAGARHRARRGLHLRDAAGGRVRLRRPRRRGRQGARGAVGASPSTRSTTTTTSPGASSTAGGPTGSSARAARRPSRVRRGSSAARWATSR